MTAVMLPFHVQIASSALGGCFVLCPPLGGVVRERLAQPHLCSAIAIGASQPQRLEQDWSSQPELAVDVRGRLTAERRALDRQPPAAGHDAPSSGSAASGAVQGAKKKEETCDKCDGNHPTDACPHFNKAREKHKDAWVNYGRKHPREMGTSGGSFVLRRGQTVPQPGDGSCLFHSLCYGLNRMGGAGRHSAGQLRRELMQFIEANPHLEVAGDTLEEWVRWDSNSSVPSYTRRMACGGWGGGIEMAACALLKKVNVHVYERRFFWWLSSDIVLRLSRADHAEHPRAVPGWNAL